MEKLEVLIDNFNNEDISSISIPKFKKELKKVIREQESIRDRQISSLNKITNEWALEMINTKYEEMASDIDQIKSLLNKIKDKERETKSIEEMIEKSQNDKVNSDELKKNLISKKDEIESRINKKTEEVENEFNNEKKNLEDKLK